MPTRHARPCAGHPRLLLPERKKDVDGRVKPGHDEDAKFRFRRSAEAASLPPALPRRSDRRPAPARAETAAIVASADKPGPAEIGQLAVIAEILRGIIRLTCDGSLPAIDGDGIVRRLMVAGEKAVAVPVIGVSLLRGRA